MQPPSPTKVIVEQTPAQAGALFIPEAARVKPMDGIVHSVGSGVRELRAGDHVLVNWQNGGTGDFHHGGKDYWLLNENQVLARIE
jgi:co-chaperonin GroES (HSP10)